MNLTDFDGFGWDDLEDGESQEIEKDVDVVGDLRQRLSSRYGGEAALLSPDGLVRGPITGEEGLQQYHGSFAIYYIRNKAWFTVYAGPESKARSVGEKVLKSLVPRTKVRASDPLLHDRPFHVIWYHDERSGIVDVEPLEKKVRETKEVSLSDEKERLVRKTEAVFGRGVGLRGNLQKGWILSARPTRKDHHFAEWAFSFTDFSEAHARLDEAIAKYEAYVRSLRKSSVGDLALRVARQHAMRSK